MAVETRKIVVTSSSQGRLLKMGGLSAYLGTTLLVLTYQFSCVRCDITDGNAEHLKREHSLMKPYQGKGRLFWKLT